MRITPNQCHRVILQPARRPTSRTRTARKPARQVADLFFEIEIRGCLGTEIWFWATGATTRLVADV
jgi:hypothetical protein